MGTITSAVRRVCAAASAGTTTDDRGAAAGALMLSPVRGGQALLLAAGVPVAVAVPLLQPSARGWTAVGAVSALMLLALALSAVVPWRRLPTIAALAFPALVCLGLIGLDVLAPGMAAPLTGLLVLCFAYVGLAHRPGSGLLLFPLAAATFVLANGGWSRVTSIRVVLIGLIWLLLAELLARLCVRQHTLSLALRAAAHTDVLTGVGNRREIDLRLLAAQTGDTIVLCDLDHFKSLNDDRGHLAGDQVLADFGALLRAELRASDLAGRFGGEEFLLLLSATDLTSARRLVQRLHRSWAQLHPEVTFSAGLAGCRSDRAATATIAAADTALYAAKTAGRDTDRLERHLSEPTPAADPPGRRRRTT